MPLIKGQLGEELRRPRLGAHRSCYRCSGSLCISELCHEFNCHITQALTKRQLGPWQQGTAIAFELGDLCLSSRGGTRHNGSYRFMCSVTFINL